MCGLVKGAQGIEIIHQSKPLGRLLLFLEVASDLLIIITPLELRKQNSFLYLSEMLI